MNNNRQRRPTATAATRPIKGQSVGRQTYITAQSRPPSTATAATSNPLRPPAPVRSSSGNYHHRKSLLSAPPPNQATNKKKEKKKKETLIHFSTLTLYHHHHIISNYHSPIRRRSLRPIILSQRTAPALDAPPIRLTPQSSALAGRDIRRLPSPPPPSSLLLLPQVRTPIQTPCPFPFRSRRQHIVTLAV